jgi:hypothetical protein
MSGFLPLPLGGRHLVSEWLQEGDRWGMRVLQKKCVLTGLPLTSRPFVPFDAETVHAVELFAQLARLVERLPEGLAESRQEGTSTMRPVLQTARGLLVSGDSIVTRANAFVKAAALASGGGSATRLRDLRRGFRERLLSVQGATARETAEANLRDLAVMMDHTEQTVPPSLSSLHATTHHRPLSCRLSNTIPPRVLKLRSPRVSFCSNCRCLPFLYHHLLCPLLTPLSELGVVC